MRRRVDGRGEARCVATRELIEEAFADLHVDPGDGAQLAVGDRRRERGQDGHVAVDLAGDGDRRAEPGAARPPKLCGKKADGPPIAARARAQVASGVGTNPVASRPSGAGTGVSGASAVPPSGPPLELEQPAGPIAATAIHSAAMASPAPRRRPWPNQVTTRSEVAKRTSPRDLVITARLLPLAGERGRHLVPGSPAASEQVSNPAARRDWRFFGARRIIGYDGRRAMSEETPNEPTSEEIDVAFEDAAEAAKPAAKAPPPPPPKAKPAVAAKPAVPAAAKADAKPPLPARAKSQVPATPLSPFPRPSARPPPPKPEEADAVEGARDEAKAGCREDARGEGRRRRGRGEADHRGDAGSAGRRSEGRRGGACGEKRRRRQRRAQGHAHRRRWRRRGRGLRSADGAPEAVAHPHARHREGADRSARRSAERRQAARRKRR